ncbi:polysaccharide lyase family 7 protein [Neiella marina]|uniref:Polysaccharide lyase family 7 protein n=1 Tax=Neiella holothuriorum TaxID=2870530 RepID=A0ABS7EMP4_9GAMM|nr:polysaccharide lyase family 7 protein [Neiella holothuriorum]MBW8192851.1 polysaccharide lyase family 7 protein [Neiella holothuriorum]
MKLYSRQALIVLPALIVLSACGGGGSSGSTPTTPSNNAPVAGSNAFSMDEDGSLTLSQSQLLEGASDADGDDLTVSDLASSDTDISISDNGDGSFTITPAADYNASGIALTFNLSDGSDTVRGSATLDIAPVNDLPTASDLDFSMSEDGSLTFTDSQLLAVADDVDGDTLSITDVSYSGSDGMLVDNNDGSYTFSPDTGFSGTVTLAFTVSDGTATATANINVTVVEATDPSECTTTTLTAAYDDGSNDGNGPENAIDGDTSDGSRWASEGDGKWLIVDLGDAYFIDEIRTAWYNSTTRTAYFDLQYSLNGSDWTDLALDQESTLGNAGFDATDVDPNVDGRYVRLVGHGNSDDSNGWNSLREIEVSNCGLSGSNDEEIVLPEPDPGDGSEPGDVVDTPAGTPSAVLDYSHLDNSVAPSDNFDLTRWYISVPTDTDNNGKSDSIYENALSSGYENDDFFFTAADGGMKFICPIDGYKTWTNTTYTRVELRGMLRAGDTSISTQGVNENNWVFSSAPTAAQNAAGGVDGTLKATLAVNHVTNIREDGNDYNVGRIVIGQIHADEDEPIRLYYRKLPENTKGSIYFAHEPTDATGYSELWVDLVGSRSSTADDPEDGIALDEKFSYEINVVGNVLSVSILRDGKDTVTKSISMNGSGYDIADDYMYFKAGIYMADKLQQDVDDYADSDPRPDEYAEATFYALEATHN